MAAYTLFLGAPTGDAVLNNPERRKNPDASFGIGDSDVIALGLSLDPYICHQAWSGPALDALKKELERKLSRWRRETVTAVLQQTGAPAVASWLEAMIERKLAADTRVTFARQLLELVTRAQLDQGTVVYWGD